MKRIGIELMTTQPIQCDVGTYVHCHLEQEGMKVPHSEGKTEYHVSRLLPAAHRIAVTGRTWVCQFTSHPLKGQPFQCLPSIEVGVKERCSLVLKVQTNISALLSTCSPPFVIHTLIERDVQTHRLDCLRYSVENVEGYHRGLIIHLN